jgi:hypothetical protein
MMRGIVVNAMTEVESMIDDLLLKTLIRKNASHAFLDMLLWPELTLSLKIRMFEAIPLRDELKPLQEDACKEVMKLATIRNKFAHGLSVIDMDKKRRKAVIGLIVKKHNLFPVTEKTFNDFADKYARIVNLFEKIMYAQKGLKPPTKETFKWIPLDRIDS